MPPWWKGTRVLISWPGIIRAILIASIALILICFIHPIDASAYTVEKHDDAVTGQFVISPTKVELEMKPGESVSRDIVVANRTGITLTVEFSVEDFEGSEDPAQATVFLGDEDGSWGGRRWLEPELSSIVIKHGETATFRTKVNVPKNARPGGHYAALFASSTYEAQDEQGSAINKTSRISSFFLIKVAGAVRQEGTLDPPEVPAVSEYGPIDIGLVFRNQGNTHLKPSGRVIITNILGQTTVEIPVSEWVVLPESARRNVVKWDSHYLFGRYTAKAEIGYTPDGTPIIVSSSFWVIPWKIVLGIAAGVILLMALVSWLVRRRRGVRHELGEEELDELRAVQRAKEAPEVTMPPGTTPAPSPEPKPGLIALSELFPSMDDSSMIDLDDGETQKLVRGLISQEVYLARSYIHEGRIEDARHELLEARSAAQCISLLAEIGMIDDMLNQL